MIKSTIDIIIPLMEFLRDKEFHSLTDSCLHLQKALKLSIKEKNDYYESRNGGYWRHGQEDRHQYRKSRLRTHR